MGVAGGAYGDGAMKGLRLWRRIRVLPGVTLNLSKSGLSMSVGPRGAKMTIGPRGRRITVGLPGTGLSYTRVAHPTTRRADSNPRTPSAHADVPATRPNTAPSAAPRREPIRTPAPPVTELGTADDARAAQDRDREPTEWALPSRDLLKRSAPPRSDEERR